jgi:asparagine N-glycosylation enzyme membrane subunit Stt3
MGKFRALYLQAVNLLFGWLGVNAYSLRLLPAIGGTLAIPAIYLLGRQISNHRIGLIAAILLAFSHTHIHFSRTAAVAYIHSTWLVPLELYFLLSGLKKRQAWRAAVGGLLLGFHFSIYLTSQIITGLVFVYMLIGIFIFRSQLKEFFRVMSAFWGGLILMLVPHAVYFLRHPNEFFARLNVDGTFQSGWLANTIANTGQSAVTILSGRVLHAFLSLIYYPAFDFYGSRIPMLTLFTAALFLLGLGISLWKTFSPSYIMLNGYFWAATIAVGVFSIPASADSYRMLIALPAALIMAAVALDSMLSALGMGWEKWKRGYALIVSAVLTSVILFNLWVYFIDFVGRCRYGNDNPQTRYYSYLGSYLGRAPREAPIYLLSDDAFPYPGNPAIEFLSGNRQISSTNEPVDALELVSGDIVIADPNRINELAAWVHANPGGDSHLELDCSSKILLVYQLP